MPSDYELSTDPGDGQGIAVGEFALADGTVSLILPKHWSLEREDFPVAHFSIADLDGATLTVKIEIFDDPAAIAANDLLGYVTHPAFPPLADDALDHVRDAKGVPDFEKLTVRARGVTPSHGDGGVAREASRIWRKLGLRRPNLIRVLEVVLSVREEDAGSEAAQDIEGIVDHLLKFTKFADHETAADRIAPSVELRRASLWDTIAFRVPVDWPEAERENEDGTGMYVFDDKEADRWTLWIDFNIYRNSADDPPWSAAQIAADLTDATKKEQSNLIEATHDPMHGRPNEAVAKVVYGSIEDGEQLRHVSWHKIVVRNHTIIMGHFTLVVPEEINNDPDIVALTALLERECGNAVLVDRDADKLQRPAVGNA